MHLVYVSRKYLPLKIRTLRDFFIERISQTPEPRPLAVAAECSSAPVTFPGVHRSDAKRNDIHDFDKLSMLAAASG
jgi:hypothetical protein